MRISNILFIVGVDPLAIFIMLSDRQHYTKQPSTFTYLRIKENLPSVVRHATVKCLKIFRSIHITEILSHILLFTLLHISRHNVPISMTPYLAHIPRIMFRFSQMTTFSQMIFMFFQSLMVVCEDF